jgi:hypothetical protein
MMTSLWAIVFSASFNFISRRSHKSLHVAFDEGFSFRLLLVL